MKLFQNSRRHRLVLSLCLIHHGSVQNVDVNIWEWKLHRCIGRWPRPKLWRSCGGAQVPPRGKELGYYICWQVVLAVKGDGKHLLWFEMLVAGLKYNCQRLTKQLLKWHFRPDLQNCDSISVWWGKRLKYKQTSSLSLSLFLAHSHTRSSSATDVLFAAAVRGDRQMKQGAPSSLWTLHPFPRVVYTKTCLRNSSSGERGSAGNTCKHSVRTTLHM